MKGLKLPRTNNYLTVKEVFNEYQRYNSLRNLAEQTLIHKEQNIKRFFEFIGDGNYLIKEVNKELVNNYNCHLMNGDIKAVTVNTYLRNLRAFINLCADNNHVEG